METLNVFVERLSKSVGCCYHQNGSGIFSLERADTNVPRRMGVFGWVLELRSKGVFRVDTYEDLADKAGVGGLADGVDPNMHWGQPGVYSSMSEKVAPVRIIKKL